MLLQATAMTAEMRPDHIGHLSTFGSAQLPARELRETETQEVLTFLSVRPAHTVIMTSFIQDNGIEGELNRGKFYGYRNTGDMLEGVALVGHTTMVEARSEEALKALALAARTNSAKIHVIMSSGDAADKFWNYLSGGKPPRLTCTETLFEIAFPLAVKQSEWQIVNADMSQLLDVARAQADVAFLESGVDPMLRDREGFLKRVARRIDQKRVFVAMDGDTLVFKADIVAATDTAAYLEGVYVGPNHRGRGIGSECLSTLSRELLQRVDRICLLSNVSFTGAHKTFQRAGFKNMAECTTLFV